MSAALNHILAFGMLVAGGFVAVFGSVENGAMMVACAAYVRATVGGQED